MIYGLYLSAAGISGNSHRIDVTANNLANSETTGFKRHLALFEQRRTAAEQLALDPRRHSHPMLEALGGGMRLAPTLTDLSQGPLEATGSPLDVAIKGSGFFAVTEGADLRLTRSGRFMVDQAGYLTTDLGQRVLDNQRRPILLDPELPVQIGRDGQVLQGGEGVATLGVFDVPNRMLLEKKGGNLLAYPEPGALRAATGVVVPEHLERSNVVPTMELAALMDAQRQLEANANMIRYQDQTMGRLVNDVGRIG